MPVKSFLHYALEVPDQTVGQKYYQDFGLVIPEDCGWEPRDFPAEDALYVWGPPLPDDFGENRELAT
jgi:hypothetical protein